MTQIENLINLFDEREDLEDKMDMINLKIEVAIERIKSQEQTYRNTIQQAKKYKTNWLHDF